MKKLNKANLLTKCLQYWNENKADIEKHLKKDDLPFNELLFYYYIKQIHIAHNIEDDIKKVLDYLTIIESIWEKRNETKIN